MRKKNSEKISLMIIAIALIVIGIILLLINLTEDIKFVLAEILLTLGGGLLGFLSGAKLKEKVNFTKVTIGFAVIFCLLAWIKLLTYDSIGDGGKIILSALLSGITGVWFSNISADEIK